MQKICSLLFCIFAGSGFAEELSSQSTVKPLPDGGTITFHQLKQDLVVPKDVARVAELTTEQTAAQAQSDGKEHRLVIVSASVLDNGSSALEVGVDGGDMVNAVSNVDFRWLSGVSSLETDTSFYTLVMTIGPAASADLNEAEVQAMQWLPGADDPAFVLAENKVSLTESEQAAADAVEALLNYFDANRASLQQQFVEREQLRLKSERAARAISVRPPKQAVIQFRKLPQRKQPLGN